MFPRWIAALPLALILLACGKSDVTVYALIERDPGVKVGTPVLLDGDTIGAVVALALAPDNQHLLRLRIPTEQAQLLPADSRILVARKAILVGDVFLDIAPGEGLAIADGDTLRGETSWLQQQRSKLSEALTGLSDPKLREDLDRLRKNLEDAARQGRESWDELVPELEDQLQQLLDEMETTMPRIAEDLEKQLQRLMEEMERSLDQKPPSNGSDEVRRI